jgi:hypothetical protein
VAFFACYERGLPQVIYSNMLDRHWTIDTFNPLDIKQQLIAIVKKWTSWACFVANLMLTATTNTPI